MTEVLDLIGEQLQRAAQRQADRARAHPHQRRVTSWLFAAPHDGRRRPRWRSPRALGALLVAATVTAGGAYGAVRLIGVGSPAPRSSNPRFELYVGGRTQLLSVRAADPAGGPPWAIELVREKNSPNTLYYGPSPALCVKIGRVLDGRIGVIGSYGAFHNDGLFHPASITSGLLSQSGCYIGSGTQPPTLSQITFAGDGELVANGLAGCKREPLPLLLPPSARADPPAEKKRIEQAVARERHQAGLANERYDLRLLAELRANSATARTLAKRRGVSIATLRAVVEYDLSQARLLLANKATYLSIATCPAKRVRTWWAGFAGSNATTETLTGHGIHLTEQLNPHEQGAYLFVLPGPGSHWSGVYTTVTCRNDHSYPHSQSCRFRKEPPAQTSG